MIAAGMLVGTLFTLFVLPTFYVVMGGRKKARVGADDVGAANVGADSSPRLAPTPH